MKTNLSSKDLIKQYTPVTQPFLPPLEEFLPYLEKIWKSKWLTNNGEFHRQLEWALCKYLGVKYISLFANGTLALMIALQELRVTGEVITTPFSFVATTHCLWWNNIKPVFVDIDPDTCNIDANKIEAAITPNTTAILPVHVYGNPCNVEKIREIADKYGLKVIYDAAHCFGVKLDNRSILQHGDLSILSFHATKVFNTFEGGAIVCPDEKTKKRIDYLKNFGFADETTVVGPGINAKMNEIQAAFGLLQLKYIDENIEKRRRIVDRYRKELGGTKGLRCLEYLDNVRYNYGYFPVLIDKEVYGLNRDQLYDTLKEHGIWGRKYFYPLISSFSTYSSLPSSSPENLKNAHEVANKVLCLPIYQDLKDSEQRKIIRVIKSHTK